MMQQQFFSLSPMAGQESFGNPLDVRPSMMAHTPTTSSMLAALQADTFGSALDPNSNAYGTDSFASLSYLDPSPISSNPEDPLSVNSSGLSFPDYVTGTSFDVSAFTPQELGLSASGTPPSTTSESENNESEVKSES